jgi:integrase
MADGPARRAGRGALVNGISAEELMDCWEAAGCGHDAAVLARLWASVPPGFRLPRLSPDTVPARYRGGFAGDGKSYPAVDVSALPEPMRQEVTWCMFRIIELGGRVQMPGTVMLARRLTEIAAGRGDRAPWSLTDLPARAWLQQIPLAVHRRRGRLPAPSSVMQMRQVLLRFLWLLDLAYDTRPWWQRESWHPVEDPRIPVRQHEPLGRQAIHFHRITEPWLRRAAQWHGKVGLETGALRWSTLNQRVFALTVLNDFLAARGIRGPRLDADPARVRQLMLEFLGHVRASRASRGPTKGQPVSPAHAKTVLVHAEQFYLFMHDHKDEAAAATGEPGWAGLGAGHAGFYRPRELPRPGRRDPGRDVIGDTAMAKIMAGIGRLGEPAGEGGLGDPQAMRIMMLQARLGRRISEILMLDPDPLLPLAAGPAAAAEPDAMTARLRYQQTKIDGAPDTILVDAEVVAVIREQQDWAAGWLAEHAAPGARPRYLFLGLLFNRNADRPYVSATLHRALTELARRLDIRDSAGRLVDFQRTHRFRHTRATSLLNAGVPIHVVQRYLGTPVAGDDHALRADPGRDPRGRVPALPQADRRRPGPADRRG